MQLEYRIREVEFPYRNERYYVAEYRFAFSDRAGYWQSLTKPKTFGSGRFAVNFPEFRLDTLEEAEKLIETAIEANRLNARREKIVKEYK